MRKEDNMNDDMPESARSSPVRDEESETAFLVSANRRTTFKHNHSYLRCVEGQTTLRVAMAKATTLANLTKCNDQSLSPLYILPGEVRMEIFRYAATATVHPKDTGRFTYSTGWLSACRRIWLEANGVFDHCEHRFYFDGKCGACDDLGTVMDFRQRFKAHHVHYYGPTFLFAGKGDMPFDWQMMRSAARFRPGVFTCTLRLFGWKQADFDEMGGHLSAWLLWSQTDGIPEIRFELEVHGSQQESLRGVLAQIEKSVLKCSELVAKYEPFDSSLPVRYEKWTMELQPVQLAEHTMEKTALYIPYQSRYQVYTLTWKTRKEYFTGAVDAPTEIPPYGRTWSTPPPDAPSKATATEAHVTAREDFRRLWRRQHSLLELVEGPERGPHRWEKVTTWPLRGGPEPVCERWISVPE